MLIWIDILRQGQHGAGFDSGRRSHFASCAAGLLTVVEIPFDEKTQTFVSQIGGHFATVPLPQMFDSLAVPLSMADPCENLTAGESWKTVSGIGGPSTSPISR